MSTSQVTEAKKPAVGLPRPVVAIVGRPNVGKSALFNRMLGRRQALVEEIPGTTRDRLYGDVSWRGEQFRLVDTGGLDPEAEEGYSELIRRQVELAMAEAAVLLFVVDAKDGLIPADEEVAEVLRRSGKPVYLLANKVDNEARLEAAVQFYELGLGEPIPVSAQHGTGVADVLDRVLESLPPAPEEAPVEALRLAIVGRPNVGKSMLLNAILGEERVIVSPVPGTTRDAVDTSFEFEGHALVLVDTAGLRRPGKIGAGLEHHAVLRARHALERADTALVLFDASERLTAQDLHIVGFAIKAKTGVVVVANKWDLMEGISPTEFEQAVRRRLPFASWVSFRTTSAKTGLGITALIQEALRLCDERRRRIETGPLNALIQRAVAEQPPPPVRNQRLKLLYVTQPEVAPPTFVFFVNDASLVHFSYRRYLENVIRRRFGFDGVALRLAFRSRRER
ncbi:MAG: ribosome biogenesis GTPase Der [Chloroflexi bacterium RBG_16_68_14]|nr:MAG: ribosome biogenesis GTPase Der [Chloroflexi bacterium RBG_16_68_14]